VKIVRLLIVAYRLDTIGTGGFQSAIKKSAIHQRRLQLPTLYPNDEPHPH
jgi:hypothetical protein